MSRDFGWDCSTKTKMNSGLSSQAPVQDCRKYVFEAGGWDRGATLRLGVGGWGGTVSDSILGGGGA